MDANNRVAIAPDHMSFTVSGDFSVTASSSQVEVSIQTEVLQSGLQNAFNVNTTIAGTFAYIPSGSGPAPTLSTFAATSDLIGIPGSATVSLPPSPVSLPTAPNFPTGGLNLSGSANAIATIPSEFSPYENFLEQTTTILFNNVTAGQTLQISLPISTSLTSVPEPGSVTLLSIGGVLAIGSAVWRRNRGRSGGLTSA
jgi:hypothetical protein